MTSSSAKTPQLEISSSAKTPQLEIWEGDFGKEYVDRVSIDHAARVKTFQQILAGYEIRSVLEVGCCKGDNLVCLHGLGYHVQGVEPMRHAVSQAQRKGLDVRPGNCFNLSYPDNWFDLVFTAGVLMHVEPKDLGRARDEVWRVSRKYLLVIEYGSWVEESVPYRGHTNLLWKRNYSSLGAYPLSSKYLGKETGFDNCTYWMFQKDTDGLPPYSRHEIKISS